MSANLEGAIGQPQPADPVVVELKPSEKALPDPPLKYGASVFADNEPLDDSFVAAVQGLESALQMPVVMLIQNATEDKCGTLSHSLYQGLLDELEGLEKEKPVALLLESPGGDPRAAFKIARLLQAHCKGYVVVIPSYAKSAATLLSLGASRIILGPFAELGPLDMQVEDPDREDAGSALNHVQTLERLSAFALRTMDQTMLLMLQRTSKKVSSIMPAAMDFASSMVRPLLENLDVVRYTEMSRILKVGEAYAERLMRPAYGRLATVIAAKLVSDYPDHGFVIDYAEACAIGLKVEQPNDAVAKAMAKVLPFLNDVTAIGKLRAVQPSK